MCLGTIAVVFIAFAAASVIAAVAVNRAAERLNEQALPPQGLVAELGKAYVDQETGQRGFMLTGDPISLQPYLAGRAEAGRLVAELEDSLADDAEASGSLEAVVAAARDWVTGAAEPQIAERRAGPIPPDRLAGMTLAGMRLFDQLRAPLSALQIHTNTLMAQQVNRVRTAQRMATIAEVVMAVALLAALILCDWLLRHKLTRPVARMLQDVTAVAGGEYDRPISSAGLSEIADLSTATETMRQRLRTLLVEKEQTSSQRADAEVRYRILADNSVDVIAHLRGREVVWISRSAETAFGWPAEEWIGTDFGPRIHPDDLDAVVAVLAETTADSPAGARCRVSTADGDYHWLEFRAKPYIDARGNTDGMITSARIIDRQVESENQIRADQQRFEAVLANMPSAISLCDLERRFTQVNEAFCELFGYQSVVGVIGRTEDEILPPDVLQRSRPTATRLLAGESLVEEEPIAIGPEDISVMTQRFPLRNSAGEITELVTIRTDITHRKKSEREAAERALWEDRIRSAIGDGRLLVYSQPIVDIRTAETVEEELLVRLRAAATEQILPPSEFLPQCQHHKLMSVIDRYMVGRAIELAYAGRRVCVNISGQTIGDHTAMREILQTLTPLGPDIADKIVFEITETTALTSLQVAKGFSQQMSSLGCRVALDDFGTGYGAFTELRNLDLHTLKIDLSFVQNMLEDADDERVVNTIVFVARQYGLTTVAEGVETQALLDKLAVIGVDRAQGYLFGKPAPIAF